MKPKITVIIPVYKVEQYLRQCLDSVVNQTYRNLEIIIIDDGSPDNCPAICDEYGARDHRITVIHKKNSGLCAARNDGIKRATGDWITFVDSDDWCELDYYEQLLQGMGDHSPDIMCAGGKIAEYPFDARVEYTFTKPFYYTQACELKELMAGVIVWTKTNEGEKRRVFGFPWDKLYKTAFLRDNNLQFDDSSRAWEDLWFNFQAFDKASSICGCSYVGYHYRQVATSIVNGFNPDKPEINYDFISKLHCYVEKNTNLDLIQAIEARTIVIIFNSLGCYYFHPDNEKPFSCISIELNEMKKKPYFRNAIWGKNNQYLGREHIVFKYMLRLPWVFPLKLVYFVNEKRKEILLKRNGREIPVS